MGGGDSCCLLNSFIVQFLAAAMGGSGVLSHISTPDVIMAPRVILSFSRRQNKALVFILTVQALKIFINKVSGLASGPASGDSSSIRIILSSFSTIPALIRKRIAISEKAFV